MRAAVIGLGWWGKQIIKCLNESKKIDITHAFDPQISKDDPVFSKFSVDPSLNFDAIIDSPSVDAVILATPNQFHEEQVISAANKGKQVFCEKPVALNMRVLREWHPLARKMVLFSVSAMSVDGSPQWSSSDICLMKVCLEKSCIWRQILVTISL